MQLLLTLIHFFPDPTPFKLTRVGEQFRKKGASCARTPVLTHTSSTLEGLQGQAQCTALKPSLLPAPGYSTQIWASLSKQIGEKKIIILSLPGVLTNKRESFILSFLAFVLFHTGQR